jgi:acetylornithine deacetylase/succinyl-diaminopimelate desuccinylase-like protein
VREQVETVLADARMRRAFRDIFENETAIEADQVRITLIPAPPFGESVRAECLAQELHHLGFKPSMDGIGNVIAAYDGMGERPVVVAAHLDTVFPASTRLELKKRGRILFLPGVSDNGCGLVALLWCFRVARRAGLRFKRPVVAVGDVGEEGEGNLRGIRHLFASPPWEGRACDFIAVDGAGLERVTHQALGSRRFRIRMTGPGGHSWADFGRPNPVHAMARAIHSFTQGAAGRRPGTSFNVGVLRGGISVNAIPSDSFMEVDLRSVNPSNLDDIENTLRAAVAEAAVSARVDYSVELMGERPSGKTPATDPVIQAAREATRQFNMEPQLDVGSTDANLPMSLGIPAVAIGAGGASGDVHTTGEWFDPTNRHFGLQRLLTVIAALAGLE